MYRSILVPTDGSDAAGRAVLEAYELARKFDATLHALYVVDVDQKYPLDVSTDPIVEGVRAEADALLGEIEREAPGTVDVVTAVEEGAPADRILAYADGHDADLIVMGTHGRSGLDRYLLGSVTERVTREADQSVLVTGPKGDDGSE